MLKNITCKVFKWSFNRSCTSVTKYSPIKSLFGTNQEALVSEGIHKSFTPDHVYNESSIPNKFKSKVEYPPGNMSYGCA